MEASPIRLETIIQYALYAITLYGLTRFFVRRHKKSDEVVNWTIFESISVTLGVYFGSQWLLILFAQLFILVAGWDEARIKSTFDNPSAGLAFTLTFFSYGAMAALVLFFIRKRQSPLKLIGIVRPKLRDIYYALAGFGAYFVIYAFFVSSLVNEFLPVDTEQRQQLGFDTSTIGPELILIFISLTILPPLVEELVVRGFLYTGLRTGMAKLKAALLASLIFGAAHLEWGSDAPLLWTAAIDTFVLSMVLIWLREKTGSLWPGIGVHFIKNTVAFVALFIFKVG